MGPMEAIKSVQVGDNYAALVTRDDRYGVAQMMSGKFTACFYDTMDLALEVFAVVSQEVMDA